jgi:hypothetical protein
MDPRTSLNTVMDRVMELIQCSPYGRWDILQGISEVYISVLELAKVSM